MTYLTRSSQELGFFADDTAIYLDIISEGESITMQNDLFNLGIWEQRWNMNFNPSKCQVLHITRAKCLRYILHGTVLESVPSAEYLGIRISDNLSWSPHKAHSNIILQNLKLCSAGQPVGLPVTTGAPLM